MAVILVTGTSRGIGLSTSLVLARAGHQVLATMRSPSRAPELADAARAEGLPVLISAMDVDSDESVRTGMAALMARHGTPDILVNNAGIERRGSVEELPLAEFKAVMETNYFGAIRCMQAVLPGMRTRGSGGIINVTSVAGKISNSPLGPYAASKFALEALTEALAQEVTPFGLRVAMVEPGIIDTAMAQAIGVDPKDSLYPNARRLAGLFAASLATPTPPDVVADAIAAIVASDTWKLRYPVGPDAIPFLEWRASLSDEEWTAWSAMGDDDWYAAVERDFGLKAR